MFFLNKKNSLLMLVIFSLFVLGQSVVKAGRLSPTIYYVKTMDLDKTCNQGKKSIYNNQGKLIAKVCADQYKACLIEGTCALYRGQKNEPMEVFEITANQYKIINYTQTKNGMPLFLEVDQEVCPWGLGVSQACLDPYYTIAADMRYHKAGEVIYVDKIKGLKLPNGEIHSGFLIIRDRGGAIKGPDRFDFFTGFYSDRHTENPFTPLGLAGSNNRFEYRKATPKESEYFRQERLYPKVPTQH